MPPKSPSSKSPYKSKLKLDLEKLKNGEAQATKVDLTKIKTNTLAKKMGLLSEDVKMYMYLVNSKRHHVLNDRTISLLMGGDIDMSATTSETAGIITDSGKEVVDLINVEQEVELLTVEKNKTSAGGSFFPYLNTTIFDLYKYGIFESVDGKNYKHNCLYLALQAGGLSDIKLQGLILTLRNRNFHKCELSNLCNTLEINIELISIRNDGKTSDVDHYPQSPHTEYDGKYKLGLVKGHYFINDYTELTSYNSENYEEIKDIKDCNNIFKKHNDEYKKCNDRFIEAFQLFKVLMGNVDKPITPMELTDEVLNTQFYDKGNGCRTPEYNLKNAD